MLQCWLHKNDESYHSCITGPDIQSYVSETGSERDKKRIRTRKRNWDVNFGWYGASFGRRRWIQFVDIWTSLLTLEKTDSGIMLEMNWLEWNPFLTNMYCGNTTSRFALSFLLYFFPFCFIAYSSCSTDFKKIKFICISRTFICNVIMIHWQHLFIIFSDTFNILIYITSSPRRLFSCIPV